VTTYGAAGGEKTQKSTVVPVSAKAVYTTRDKRYYHGHPLGEHRERG